MAASRLERIGTIFSRVSSLMKGGALNPDNKPIWYDIYEAFPPKLEPNYDRPAPNIEIRDIYYKEDVIRAKFQKEHSKLLKFNFFQNDVESMSQKFLAIYNDLEKSGIPEEELYEKAVENFKAQNLSFRERRERNSTNESEEINKNKHESSPKLNIKIDDMFPKSS